MSGRSMRLWAVVLAAGAVASHAVQSRAQITTYTTEAAFQAALVPGSVTNSFPDIPNFTPAGPARYVEGTPYASYNIYCPATLFADSGFSIGGQTVRGVGNYGYGSPVYLDFSSNNVRQFGASFFLCDFFGAPVAGDVTVQFFDGSSTTVPIVTGSVPTNMGSSGGPNFFGVSVANSGQAIRSLTIPRYPGTDIYVNIGPVTTTAFDDVARFWSGGGSATTLGGSGTWASAGSNWAVSSASIGAWDPTKRAVFSGTGGTVTVDAGGVSSARGIAFDASGYFLQGPGTVTLTGTSTAANDVYVGPSIAPSIATTLSAASGFAKTGPGILRVTGTATGGPVTISRGVLQVGNGGTSGAIAASSIVNSAELEFNRSDDHGYAGTISGSGAVFITGSGRTTLSGAGTYTGVTSILSSGTLAITNAAAVAGSVRVATGSTGVFDVSAVPGGYAVPGTQTISGGGTAGGSRVIGTMSLGGNATVSPGVGRGTLTMSGSLVLGGGGNYNWQADDLSQPAGLTTSYDLISVTGPLSITSTPADPFKVNLWSVLPAGGSGPAFGFDPLVSSTYTLITTSGGISGFAANKFTINVSATNGTEGFINDLAGGSFRVAQGGNDLNLVFAPAGSGPDPNPATLTWYGDGVNPGGGGTWTTTGNTWFDGTTVRPWVPGAKAIFSGTGGTVTLDSGLSADGGLQFTSTGYTLTGAGLVLGGTSNGVEVGSGLSATVATVLSGSGGL
ncbi:MAG: beta strand repeat-containing protein, partial [Planctomycetaceae bacterium]